MHRLRRVRRALSGRCDQACLAVSGFDRFHVSGVGMNIVSLVLRILPETRLATEAALTAMPGVECHEMSADGRLVATVEDAPGVAMSDTLIAIHRIPQVLATTLAYEYSDAQLTKYPDSPCEEAQS
jgi:nitrate reductase NapD